MNRKLLFVDLDGTLMSDDGTVSLRNREAIHRMVKEGHYIAFATGRPVESARAFAKALKLTQTGCYIVAFNGAIFYDCAADRVLFKRSMPVEVVLELFERAQKAGIYAHTYNKTDVLAVRHTKELDSYLKRTNLTYKLAHNIMDILEEEPPKVLLIDLKGKERLVRFQKDNAAWAKGKTNNFFASDEYLEYCPDQTGKEIGVKYLTDILSLPFESTIAVGDEQNDIRLIEAACVGVAVRNAVPAVKEAADFVTESDNNHDAIAEVIERFVL